MSLASSSQLPMPRATATNTTSDTGRNVPVPDRCMSNGGCARATSARGALIRVRAATGTSVGGRGGARVEGGGPGPGALGGGQGGEGGRPFAGGRFSALPPPVDQQLGPRLRD